MIIAKKVWKRELFKENSYIYIYIYIYINNNNNNNNNNNKKNKVTQTFKRNFGL